MLAIKVIHVLAVFMWIGCMVSLTHWMNYYMKQEPIFQANLSKMFYRTYHYVEFPAMCLVVITGLILLTQLELAPKGGWFHMKLTFAFLLIICDMVIGSGVRKMSKGLAKGSGRAYRALHIAVTLCLVGILVSVYVVRDKKAEWCYQLEREKQSAN